MNESAEPALSFARLRGLFEQVIDLPETAREHYVAQLAAEQPEAAQALRALLAQTLSAQAERALDLPPGARFGPFAIQVQIGAGGMGQVYRAVRIDGEFEQTVALKVIAPGFESAALRQRFRRERQILARLEHPHIAHLIDGGVNAQGQLWLALEYVDGQAISQWCRDQPASVAQRLTLFADLCSAVAHAHGNLVLHRDIKPANVLVDAAGRLKLLDFGIASLLDDTGEGGVRTRQTAMTTRYAAPEQIREQQCTTATDVYALGVLLFELLSGHSPYPAAEAGRQSWVDAALHAEPESLHRTLARTTRVFSPVENQLLRGELAAILRRALAKHPADRYASVAAFAEDIADVCAGRAARSGVGGRGATLRAALRRYRWPLSMLAVVVLSLTIGIGVALLEAQEAREQSLRAQSSFNALLSVLSAASPSDYVGHEPKASEFLSAAATQIDQRLSHDPAARWRALEEIGHGLVNLGHPQRAAIVLLQAYAAQADDPMRSSNQQLDLLRLLMSAQGAPDSLQATLQTARRIQQLAHRADADPGIALDALSRAARSLSTHGELELAREFLQEVDRVMQRQPQLAATFVENIERQRGLVWTRFGELEAAHAAFTRAMQVVVAHPQDFSAMRRAELHFFLADVQSELGLAVAARSNLDAAWTVYGREFPAEHLEILRGLQIEITLALLNGHRARAQALQISVRTALARHPDSQDATSVMQLQEATIRLALADCAGAARVLSGYGNPRGTSRRRQLQLTRLQLKLSEACPAPDTPVRQ